MEIINNQDKFLIDDLKQNIYNGSKIKIAASCFSIYAFAELKKQFNDIEEMQFIFSSPAFEEGITDSLKKESKEFFMPNECRESALYGTEFELRLRNKLTQKAIAYECAEWIKKKVKFKSNTTGASMPKFIGIDSEKGKISYMPIEGFTTVELGTAKDNSIFTVIQKNDDVQQSKYIFSKFDELWHDKDKLKTVTDNIISFLSSAYKDNTPEFLYFIVLYNIFTEFLTDINEDFIPNEATGFKNSKIWNKIYNFQKDGAVGVINKLEKYNGCILSDSVGLGKTFTALAVMKYYSCRNRNILVLCPKKLSENWNQYKGNVRTNIFLDDRIRFDVLFHTDLSRKSGYSNGINLATFNWDNYDLVVIDESHNFRNAEDYEGKETRYNFLMNKVMKSGVNTKVLMLSATPVNNRYNDLKNQLMLAYCGDIKEFNTKIETKKSIDSVFRNAQKEFNLWSKQPAEKRKTQDLLDRLDMDFSILLDKVTIARSRKHITKFYDTKDIGEFPTRKKPLSLHCDLSNKTNIIELKEIYKSLISMNMSVYAPVSYILSSKLEKYEQIFDIRTESGGKLKRSGREKSIQRLMTINMLKRLESCVDSFRITINKVLNSNNEILSIINSYKAKGYPKYLEKKLSDYKEIDYEDENIDIEETGKINLEDMDLLSWERDIRDDISILTYLFQEMNKIKPEDDEKLNVLKRLIDDKIRNPFNEGNKKLLIFSAFADTVNYLYKNLNGYIKDKYGLNTAKVQGGDSNKSTISGPYKMDRLLTLFSPLSKEKNLTMPHERETIDVLIGTDCISEGQNLQDCDICINYDIHWNPVRIVQRYGRIDRIGSRNKYIQLVNFWPNITLDDYIKLNSRVHSRMAIVDATATGDDNPIAEEQSELDYRKIQLQKLQDGELQDLEDVDGSITITDLGLNEFRMDLLELLKVYPDPKRSPKGMYAVVKEDKERNIEPGVIYILKNYNRDIDIKKQNRLHPYYLVYIKDNGEIKTNHLEVKQILDIMRFSSKNVKEPYIDLCAQINKETNDGVSMQKYSYLLEKAVGSIIELKEQKDIDSLFSAGGTSMLTGDISGINDFELIAFFIVR